MSRHVTFTAPSMCEALRQLSPGSVPGQLWQAELSVREREETTLSAGAGDGSHGNRSALWGCRHTSRELGTQLPPEAAGPARSLAHCVENQREKPYPGCAELPSASLSTCRPQGTLSGLSWGQPRAARAFAARHGAFPPVPFSFCLNKLSEGIHVRVVRGDALRGAYGATWLSSIFIV